MKIYNNTNNELYYNVNWEGGGDCGSINAGDTYANPGWNGKDVSVSIRAVPTEPDGSSGPFNVTIPETKPGMSVTIGLWQE